MWSVLLSVFLVCFSSDDPQTTKQKLGTLLMQYPSKNEGKELKILIQPETQHRARYLTEGSRGSVKDRDQQGFPTVKVIDKLLTKGATPSGSLTGWINARGFVYGLSGNT